jgi:hypothetical protein
MLAGKTPAEVPELERAARVQGWLVTTLNQGTLVRRAGGQPTGFRLIETNADGHQTGHTIRWYPGQVGGRHGNNPYWVVTDGAHRYYIGLDLRVIETETTHYLQ